MKKLALILLVLFPVSLSVNAQITNMFEYADDPENISIKIQPTNNLALFLDTRIEIIKGNTNTHGYFNFEALFDSYVYGAFGGSACIFSDGLSPDSDIVLQFDFDSPKRIDEVHIFSRWGDARLFSWYEVWISTTGTNDTDYSKIGVASFGEIGDTVSQYASKYCAAKLYDDSGIALTSGVISVRLAQKNSGYSFTGVEGAKEVPGTPLDNGSVIYSNAVGSATLEIEIIGGDDFQPKEGVTNVYEWNEILGDLSAIPLPDDLAQLPGTEIIPGPGRETNELMVLNYMFNSDGVGSYGPGSCIFFPDGLGPKFDMVLYCNFDVPKRIDEIRVFSNWGDARLFTWFEIYASTNVTGYKIYEKIGVATFGEIGDLADNYTNTHCLARLYNTGTNVPLADAVMSVKLIQKNVGYADSVKGGIKQYPGTPLEDDLFNAGGSAVLELDIIGDNIPEPGTGIWIMTVLSTLLIKRYTLLR